MSEAKSFAIDAAIPYGWPRSLSAAAFQTSRRAASISVAISASFHWIAWCSTIAFPKVRRWRPYASASSKAARAMPTACAAMPMRPPSSVLIATWNPLPSAPSSAPAGSRASSRKIWHDLEPRMPSLSSGGPQRTPGVSIGTMNAEIPRCPLGLSVIAKSTHTPETGPLVIQFLTPDRTHPPSGSRRAVVVCAAASEPASGSDSAKQPSSLPAASGTSQRRFCSSLPKRRIGSHTSEFCTLMMTPVDAHARDTSSMAST